VSKSYFYLSEFARLSLMVTVTVFDESQSDHSALTGGRLKMCEFITAPLCSHVTQCINTRITLTFLIYKRW